MPHDQVDLAGLVRQHQDSTGESYAEIAKRSGLSKAKIGQLALTASPHMPRADTLAKLSHGLRLPVAVVQRAAMASAGIAPPTADPDQRIELLVSRLRTLSPDDFERVELFVLALAGRNG